MARTELNLLSQTATLIVRDSASILTNLDLMRIASLPEQVNGYDPPGWYDLLASSP